MSKIQFVENAIAQIEERSTKRQKEAAKLFFAATSGDLRAKLMLQEGISSSDIPTVLQPTINLTFLAQYAAQPTVWDQIATEYMVDDFGPIKFADFQIDPSTLTANNGSEYFAGGLPVVGGPGLPAPHGAADPIVLRHGRHRGHRLCRPPGMRLRA